MGRMQISAWFVAIAWFGAAAAASAADWVGDRQMFLDSLRAKDAHLTIFPSSFERRK